MPFDGRGPEARHAPTNITVPLRMTAEQTRARLRTVVDANVRIDPPGVATDRRLYGVVTNDAITLYVRDAHLATRRKSWNIEFRGRIDGSGPGPVLTGAIDVPDAAALRWLMRLIRIASAVPLVFAATLMLGNGITGSDAPGIVLATAIAAAAIVGSVVMENAGKEAAADDARTLVHFVRSELA